jgi:hypothetical protein
MWQLGGKKQKENQQAETTVIYGQQGGIGCA